MVRMMFKLILDVGLDAGAHEKHGGDCDDDEEDDIGQLGFGDGSSVGSNSCFVGIVVVVLLCSTTVVSLLFLWLRHISVC